MAATANLGLRLVASLCNVAGAGARDTVRAGRLVRRMARAANAVSLHRVQRGKVWASMARRARGSRGDTAWPVRTVARLAAALHAFVRPVGFARMAGSARRLRQGRPPMRFVAARTLLMSRWGGRLLLRMALATSRRRHRVMRRGPVARSAIGVPRTRGRQGGLLEVAFCTKSGLLRWGHVMACVATDACRCTLVSCRIDERDAAVTGRARGDFGVGRAVRHVAARARVLAGADDLHVGVAACARVSSRPGRVRSMAARAHRMRRGDGCGQRRLCLVAANASTCAARNEVVRLVAIDARIVAGRLWTAGLCMARRARVDRTDRGGMRRVAIETFFRPCMLRVDRRPLLVARVAALRPGKGLGVHRVALRAIDSGVRVDWRKRACRLTMASDARGRRLVGGEGMARNAVDSCARCAFAWMSMRRFGRMTSRARRASGILEPVSLNVMAIVARRLAPPDVRLVAGTCSVSGPRGRNESRRRRGRPAWQLRHEPSDGRSDHRRSGEERPRDGATASHSPTPWHARQGTS